MSGTVECIQVLLRGFGIILWPGSPDDPPGVIRQESVMREEPRVFLSANRAGPVFLYEYEAKLDVWLLEGRATNDGPPDDPWSTSTR